MWFFENKNNTPVQQPVAPFRPAPITPAPVTPAPVPPVVSPVPPTAPIPQPTTPVAPTCPPCPVCPVCPPMRPEKPIQPIAPAHPWPVEPSRPCPHTGAPVQPAVQSWAPQQQNWAQPHVEARADIGGAMESAFRDVDNNVGIPHYFQRG